MNMKRRGDPPKLRAVRGPDKAEWERPGCGFVLAEDGKTVVGRFPRYEDAVLHAAAPLMLAALIRLRDLGPVKSVMKEVEAAISAVEIER